LERNGIDDSARAEALGEATDVDNARRLSTQVITGKD